MEDGGRLMNVDVVVLDEVHYLSDISRGTVWEETVLSNTLSPVFFVFSLSLTASLDVL